jgi:hypothetical protein
MRKFELVTKWPMFFIALFLSITTACKKDGLDKFDSHLDSKSIQNHAISIAEAKSYLQSLNLPAASSLIGDSLRILNIDIDPDWEDAYLSQSLSGRDIVVAPLTDKSLSDLNDGRVGVRLLFSRQGSDTITVEIMLYVADSSYFFSGSQDLNFNTFTGFYALFDLGLHFKGGVNVVNGQPVGAVKDIVRGNLLSLADDRDDGDCNLASEVFYQECPMIASSGCEEEIVVWVTYCVNDPWGDDGAGGGTGGGTGTGTGGGGGSGIPNPWANTHWHYIFSTSIPVQWFVQGGGVLPTGLSIEDAEKLRQLNNDCQFNAAQLNWLANNSYMIPLFLEYLASNPNKESAVSNIKNIIDTASQIPPPPNNDPVSVANPICADIMDFKTFPNEGDHNYPAAGMFFRDAYFQFSRKEADPVTVNFGYLRFEAYAGSSNGNCLNACPSALANAINSAVVQVQQWIDGVPQGIPVEQIRNKAKTDLSSLIRNNFGDNIKNCNPNYTTDVQNSSEITNHLNLPIIDLDDEIVNCN